DEPAETLIAQAPARGVHLVMPRLGAAVEPSRVERVEPWWRDVSVRRDEKPAPLGEPIALPDVGEPID
ncbi:MAG TPA: hypothetical protein VF334_15985, partial [Polyangia bacterium]